MKYLIRSVKYFIYICVLLSIVLAILICVHAVPNDINELFADGYNSLGKIALMFAAVSAIYPRFGYSTKTACAAGSYAELREGVIKYMDERNYVLENEDAANSRMTFRSKSIAKKISTVFEDRITITHTFGGLEIEGLNREIVRIKAGLEYSLK